MGDPVSLKMHPLIPKWIILIFKELECKYKLGLHEGGVMEKRILMMGVFVLLMVVACTGVVAQEEPAAESSGALILTVFRSPG